MHVWFKPTDLAFVRFECNWLPVHSTCYKEQIFSTAVESREAPSKALIRVVKGAFTITKVSSTFQRSTRLYLPTKTAAGEQRLLGMNMGFASVLTVTTVLSTAEVRVCSMRLAMMGMWAMSKLWVVSGLTDTPILGGVTNDTRTL